MSKRLTIEYVKNKTEELVEGYKCIELKYTNNKTPISFICDKGHKIEISWNNFVKGSRCVKCYNNIRGNSRRLSLKNIKKEIEITGYNFLSKNYINANTKYLFKCPNNHKFEMKYSDFKNGYRCSECYGNKKLTINKIKKETKRLANNYNCISENYINSSKKLKFICDNNHKFKMSWNSFQQGHRCRICRSINMSGENSKSWRGGISTKPYCDAWADKDYKESIKERDNYECKNEDCWKKSNKLMIHHIDYNKENCSPKNLITLCNSCNARANFRRSYWEKYYNSRIRKKYNEMY